jgi:peptidoglycan/LPS O-acetylase OafA/YrhL
MTVTAHSLLTSAPVSTRRSGGIDAARGLFALWVLIFAHLIPWAIYAQGDDAVPAYLDAASKLLIRVFQTSGELHPAVLGFIVLSGYCIHRNGFRAVPADLRRFAVKRSFRILPVYFLAIAAGLLGFTVAVSLDPQTAMDLSGTTELSPLCLVAKAIALPAFVPSLGACSNQGNAPIGTVMVEIVLYAVYAVAFSTLIWRGLAKWWAVLCGAAWVAGLIVAWGYPTIYGWWQNSSVWGFLPYWWIGAAFVSPAIVIRVRGALTPLLVAWIFITLALLLGSPFGPILSECRKLIFAVLVGLLVVRLDESNISEANPVSAIGRAGYSLYALHAPLTYALCIAGVPWWLIIGINLATASAAYMLIEKRFIAAGSRLRTIKQSPAVVPSSKDRTSGFPHL